MSTKRKEKDYTVSVIGDDGKETPVDFDKINQRLKQRLNSQMEVVNREELTCQTSVKKAKITKDRTLEVQIEEHYSDGGYITMNKSCDYLVHDDLLKAFAKLDPHLVTLTEVKELETLKGGHHKEPGDYADESLENISTKGFTIGGSGDTEGVVLFGTKLGTYGAVNLITPFLQWDSPVYPFTTELINTLGECKREVMEYINGKHAQKQLEMEFDEAEVIEEE